MADLVVARRLQSAQLHPVECRLASHRRTILAPRFQLARQYRHYRIMAQLVVVVQVLITKRNPKHPLPDQSHDLVLNQILLSHIVKARCEPTHHPNRTIRLAQEQRAPSKAATTSRPSTGANPNKSGVHSVCIGGLLESPESRCR